MRNNLHDLYIKQYSTRKTLLIETLIAEVSMQKLSEVEYRDNFGDNYRCKFWLFEQKRLWRKENAFAIA